MGYMYTYNGFNRGKIFMPTVFYFEPSQLFEILICL